MIISGKTLSAAEVAEAFGVDQDTILDWETTDKKFPKRSVGSNANIGVWNTAEIAKYAREHKNENVIVLPFSYEKSGKLCILGRARTGKSFLVALFVERRNDYVKYFCSNSGDKTACEVRNIIVDEDKHFEDTFVFHTNFFQLSNSENDSDEILVLKEEIKKISNKEFEFAKSDSQSMLEKIEKVVRLINKIEKNNPVREKSYNYITVYLRPSEYAKKLLKETGLRYLEIIDTPGVSGDVEVAQVSKADMYVFVLRAENLQEAATLKKIVVQLKPFTASSKVSFLYRTEETITRNEDYAEADMATQKDIVAFENSFDDLKKCIIDTDLDVSNISQNVIALPPMNSKCPTLAEELFLERFTAKFKAAFDVEEQVKQEQRAFEKVIKEEKSAVSYTLMLLGKIPKHEVMKKGLKPYTDFQFINEKHNRVMTGDNYRLLNDLKNAYAEEALLLYKSFEVYDENNTPEAWKKVLVKFIYRTLVRSAEKDWGLGISYHFREDYPTRTMLVEESIAGSVVYNAVSEKLKEEKTDAYIEALKQFGILSKTWGYVQCQLDGVVYDEALKKLQIIKESLVPVQVSGREEMVLCRYVGGLRKMGEYKLLRQLGFSDEEAMKKVMDLPF